MRATGIIRRIDDLGRVVIPREIRRVLDIREGDPLEISVEGDAVTFQKYNAITPLLEMVARTHQLVREESPRNTEAIIDKLNEIRELLAVVNESD